MSTIRVPCLVLLSLPLPLLRGVAKHESFLVSTFIGQGAVSSCMPFINE